MTYKKKNSLSLSIAMSSSSGPALRENKLSLPRDILEQIVERLPPPPPILPAPPKLIPCIQYRKECDRLINFYVSKAVSKEEWEIFNKYRNHGSNVHETSVFWYTRVYKGFVSELITTALMLGYQFPSEKVEESAGHGNDFVMFRKV
jgi:hypothetical protein